MKAALSPYIQKRTGSLVQFMSLPGHCALAVGGQFEWADELATAWYLFYIAAHLMDSVEDHDPQEDWWVGQSTGVGINAATGLYFTANAVLNRLYHSPVTQTYAPSILNDFYPTLLSMTGGQQVDLSQDNLSLEQYWQIITDKSGSFFSLACRSGARVGAGSSEQINALSRYGKELGILIQILDDLEAVQNYLDPRAEAERIHFRHALPAVYAMAVLPEEVNKQLSGLLSEASTDLKKASEAMEIIETSGAGLYMLAEVQHHRTEALTALDETNLVEEPKELLANLIENMTTPPEK